MRIQAKEELNPLHIWNARNWLGKQILDQDESLVSINPSDQTILFDTPVEISTDILVFKQDEWGRFVKKTMSSVGFESFNIISEIFNDLENGKFKQ